MTTRASAPVAPTVGAGRLVAAVLPGLLLVTLVGEWAASGTERFGRIMVAPVLVLGVAAVAARPRSWPWALSTAVLLALVLPASAAEALVAVAAVLVTASVTAMLWRDAPWAGATRPTLGRDESHDRVVWVPPDRFGPQRWPRWVGDWAVPVLAWLAMSVLVNLTLSVSASVAGTPEGRIVWDASNFLRIAQDGFLADPRLAASFPGYPMLIRAAHEWFGVDHELAAILWSNAAGVAAAVLFWRWAGGWLGPRARLVALALLLCFPYAFVLFGVAYADGVLLALVLGSLLAVERDRYVLAGLLGAAATFTRPNGLVLVPTLFVLIAERSGVVDLGGLGARGRGALVRIRSIRFRPERLGVRQAAALLSLSGIAGLMFWMWRLFDDPLFFWSVQVGEYGHRAFADPATWLKVEFINRPGEFVHNWPDGINQVVSLLVVVVSLVSLPSVGRRYGWGYAVLGLSAVAVLWVTATGFSPAGRYLLPFVPVLVVRIAEPLSRRPAIAGGVVAAGALWSCGLAAGFAASARFNW